MPVTTDRDRDRDRNGGGSGDDDGNRIAGNGNAGDGTGDDGSDGNRDIGNRNADDGDDGNRNAGIFPLVVILYFSRHPRTALPVHAKHGNGQPIRGTLAASAILEEIPEGDYFRNHAGAWTKVYRSRMTAEGGSVAGYHRPQRRRHR